MRFLRPLILIAAIAVTSPAFAAPKFKVGVTLPLTGIAAEYGTAYKRGIELALEDAPDLSGAVEIVYDDHRYDTKTAVASAQKLLNVSKVDVLVAWGWSPSDGIAPLSRDSKTPMLLSSINPIGKDRPRVFNLASPLGHLMRPLSDRILADSVTEIAFVNTPVGALQIGVAEVQQQLGNAVKTVENITVPPEASDFRTTIAKLKAKRVQNLVLFLLPAQVRSFLQQAHSQKFHPKLYGGNTFNDAMVKQTLRPADGAPIFVDWMIKPEFEARLNVAKVPDSHRVEVAQGYFLGQLLLSLAVKAAPFSPESLADSIYYLPAGESPAGAYSVAVTEFGWHVLFPAVLYAIRDGKVVSE